MSVVYENPGSDTVPPSAAVSPSKPKPPYKAASHIGRDLYRQYFDTLVLTADDHELRNEAFRLRYQVYCVENPFEDPADNPDGLEREALDDRSVHCLLQHKRSRAMAGAVRLVLPNREDLAHSFALQEVCNDPLISDFTRFPISQMAEVSRFCVSKDFRKRQGDWLYPQNVEPDDKQDERRVIPNMTLGLIEGLVRMSLENGVFYWCAVMEPPLLRLLSRLGIHFDKIGPLVEYHGRRQPCYIPLSTLLQRVYAERPDVWDILTDGGKHWDQLECALAAKAR